MKKLSLFTLSLFSFIVCISAQDISLPTPAKSGGMPLLDALQQRQTVREYSGQALDKQQLSNLLWAAYGLNRADKRVVPSSQNRQEIDLYVALSTGVYFYDAKTNALLLRQKEVPKAAIGQPGVTDKAALTLIYVANVDKASNKEACYIDTGFLVQNVYLYCAANNLGSVARGSFKSEPLRNELKLNENQIVTLVQAVGMPK
ncbi:MAG: SagB/ThcOx family dehydrogenase [Dysgonamonadaceae bacterium]